LTSVNPAVYNAPSPRRWRWASRGDMPVKKVYVNDVLIGEASTWTDVFRLLRAKNVRFMGKPGAAEGPSAFFVNGAVAKAGEAQAWSADETG
jgi:hypothetical protein